MALAPTFPQLDMQSQYQVLSNVRRLTEYVCGVLARKLLCGLLLFPLTTTYVFLAARD